MVVLMKPQSTQVHTPFLDAEGSRLGLGVVVILVALPTLTNTYIAALKQVSSFHLHSVTISRGFFRIIITAFPLMIFSCLCFTLFLFQLATTHWSVLSFFFKFLLVSVCFLCFVSTKLLNAWVFCPNAYQLEGGGCSFSPSPSLCQV